jgi:hypothetical protein
VRQRTGTSSISLNRIVAQIDPRLNLHSNCSVQLISRQTYERFLLPYECWLAERLMPYAIHHCGDRLEVVADAYARVPGLAWVDVGWGSDIAACRRVLPDAYFSLRLSPVWLREQSPDQVRAKVLELVGQAGPLEQTALCSVAIDADCPDDNIRAMFHAAEYMRQRAG